MIALGDEDFPFDGVMATSPASIEECLRIRYQVYCLERSYEEQERNPDRLERDGYDERSVHALVRHRGSGMAIGTVRLVLHETGAKRGTLPFHAVCHTTEANNLAYLPLRATAEVSRFAISKERIQSIARSFAEPRTSAVRPCDAQIALGLLRMILEMASANKVQYLCAIMAPVLIRMLGRFGVRFEPVGPLVDYHGLRQPCFGDLSTILDRMETERLDVWKFVTDAGRLKAGRRPTRLDPSPQYKNGALATCEA